MSRVSAFSLVELLVVLSVVALVTALLLPALAAARDTASRLNCANHQRQIGTALHNYATQSDGYLPYGIETGPNLEDPVSYDERLRPHLSGAKPTRQQLAEAKLPPDMAHEIFVCPSDPARSVWAGAYATRSYAMAAPMGRRRVQSTSISYLDAREPALRLSSRALPSPTRTLMLTELSYYSTSGGDEGNFQGARRGAVVDGPNEQHPRHQPTWASIGTDLSKLHLVLADVQALHGSRAEPTCNYLMGDGHVSTMEVTESLGRGGQIDGGPYRGMWTLDPAD